jgi:hypothetical protein
MHSKHKKTRISKFVKTLKPLFLLTAVDGDSVNFVHANQGFKSHFSKKEEAMTCVMTPSFLLKWDLNPLIIIESLTERSFATSSN